MKRTVAATLVLVFILFGMILSACSSGGGLVWGTPVSYGPYNNYIGRDSQGIDTGFTLSIPSLQPGDRVSFTFTGTDCHVYFQVFDPYGNIILIGNMKELIKALGIANEGYTTCSLASASGQGAFIAAASGAYEIVFSPEGIVPLTVLTTNYTVYRTTS